MHRFWRNNGLSIVLFGLFLAFLVGQSIAGFFNENHERAMHGRQAETYIEYVGSGAFLQVTMENWESEFLQMFAYVLLTVFLFQRGSAESKSPDGDNKEPPKH